jgi:hypothetical protein
MPATNFYTDSPLRAELADVEPWELEEALTEACPSLHCDGGVVSGSHRECPTCDGAGHIPARDRDAVEARLAELERAELLAASDRAHAALYPGGRPDRAAIAALYEVR